MGRRLAALGLAGAEPVGRGVEGVVTVERELPGSAMQRRLDVDADTVPGWAVDAVVAGG